MDYVSYENFLKLLDNLTGDYRIFIPVKKDEKLLYSRYTPTTEAEKTSTSKYPMVVGEVRAFEPLKAFFYEARELVAENFKPGIPKEDEKPCCIVGVKACNLKGFKVQDFVFREGDLKDPFYIHKREKNLIISSDCTFALDTCFCLALDVKPYPQVDFDINLSPVSGGFIVTIGSDKGKAVIGRNSSLFQKPTENQIDDMEKNRKAVLKEVENNLKQNGIPTQDSFKEIIQKNYDSEIWKDEAKTCVECGACNTICPTCHCFLLYDQKSEDKTARLRIWDSCMIKDFAKVAAGVNPRPYLWMRLRNRFEKKFDFFPRVGGFYACTGCGRCISACPAKIDIRKVLKRLVENVRK